MTANELEKKQEELFLEIKQHADKKGLIRKNLQPIYDGIADIPAYLSSNPKIMWILKEPWHLYTASGNPKGGDWYFTKHFNTPEVWKDQEMWKVMIQINYGIRNNLKWSELDFIDNKPEMSEELKKIAYINVGKMPAQPVSPDGHMLDCYNTWAEIIHKQIELYSPNVIIFGKTFEYFYEYFKINEKPISTVSGKWYSHLYKKNNIILIDAFHPSRKGGENSSHDYVTSIINAYKKAIEK